MLEEFKHIQSTKKEVRDFGLLIGVIFLIIGCYSLFRHGASWPLFIPLGGFLVVVGLFFPIILRPAQKIWMGFAVIMGWIVTHVILTVFFIVCVTPFSLISRLFGVKFMETEIDPQASSYWVSRAGQRDSRNLEKQF